MKKFFTLQFWKDEMRSLTATFISAFPFYLLLETKEILLEIYQNGNVTMAIVLALAYGAWRAVVKSALTALVPSLFPPRTSKPLQDGSASN